MPPPDDTRSLTAEEVALVRSVFGDSIATAAVRLHRRAWWPLQPRRTCMAPDGDLWFHARGDLWRDDFSAASVPLQGLFVHEMTHVWQAQRGGRWYLPLVRHPFCRYQYRLTPGRPLAGYGVEQQAEIVRHGWLLARGHAAPGAGDPALYPPLLRALRQSGAD